jgi:hypothetical protein
MKIIVHKEDDALYIRLDDGEIVESEEVSEGIILDFNRNGRVTRSWDTFSEPAKSWHPAKNYVGGCLVDVLTKTELKFVHYNQVSLIT